MKKPEYTPNDINKAIASFGIVFGMHFPENLVKSMCQHLNQLADEQIRNGEPIVGMLTKDIASSLAIGMENKPRTH